MGRNKPKSSGRKGETRTVSSRPDNTRTDNFISFSFRYFQNSDTPPGQSLKTWNNNEETLLLDMQNALILLSKENITELKDAPPGQTLKTWNNNQETLLLDMQNALLHLSKENITELKKTERIKLYGKFPKRSVNGFSLPADLQENEDWGTLRKIGGQKARIAGFLRDNIFYIVYLDRDHKFYKSSR